MISKDNGENADWMDDTKQSSSLCDVTTRKGLAIRRKLINGLLGGAVLTAILPFDAIGNSSSPITEQMVLDFLERLRQVVEHDDLGDRTFIEKTLRGRFSILREGEQAMPKLPDVKRAWREFRLTSDIEPLLMIQGSHRSHTLLDEESIRGSTTERVLRLVFDTKRFGAQGITEAYVFQVFGKPLRSSVIHAKVSNRPSEGFAHRSHGYRYDKRNVNVVSFMFDEVTGYAMDIQLNENVLRLSEFGR